MQQLATLRAEVDTLMQQAAARRGLGFRVWGLGFRATAQAILAQGFRLKFPVCSSWFA